MEEFKEIRNKQGKLVAKALLVAGIFVVAYKGQRTIVQLPIGGTITIDRDGHLTRITRISEIGYIIV